MKERIRATVGWCSLTTELEGHRLFAEIDLLALMADPEFSTSPVHDCTCLVYGLSAFSWIPQD